MRRTVVVLALAGALCGPARAQEARPDTLAFTPIDTVVATATPSPPSPGSVLRRSLVVPGWGQITNGTYVRAAIAVAAVGGFAALAVRNHLQTVLYREAAIYADCRDGVALPSGTCDDFEALMDEWVEAGSLSAAQNRTLRDASRRNRDFTILLTGLAYALQALDAYVGAELADFDVSEDLSFRLVPTPTGATAALRWTF